MDDVISLQPLDGILAHNYSPPFDISLERMTGTVQKQEQGQNKSYETDRFLPTKGSLILCFHVGKGKKRLYCVVFNTGSPLRSLMALARGWRGSRKGLHRLMRL